MDVNRVSQGQRIAGIAGALLFIDLWMNWYSVNVSDQVVSLARRAGVTVPSLTADAWTAFDWTDIFLAILAVIAVAGAVMAANNTTNPTPVTMGQITAGIGALMTLLVLYRIINQPGPNNQINVEWGAYAGLVLTALVAYGGWRSTTEVDAVPMATPPAAPPPPAPAGPAV